ncbi:MAG TPA: hypothetical protein VEU62_00885 [Bryobacterales bacterium]|nr:hypothetical protein [Bryobacterales bacterium]
MQLGEATAKANQILDEERASPTISYKLNAKELSSPLQVAADLHEYEALNRISSQRPRPVEDKLRLWSFESTNYSLLRALLSQVAEESRPAFFSAVLSRMALAPACAYTRQVYQPSWNQLVSELPLVAEFCVRNGASREFFRALGEAGPLPGHAVLLRHLEDMIALSFTVFSEAEYQQLDPCIRSFRESAERRLRQDEGRHITYQWPGGASVKPLGLLQEIVGAADGIREECRKARYLYPQRFAT